MGCKKLTDSLDLLTSVGGDCFRCTMSDRDEGNAHTFLEIIKGSISAAFFVFTFQISNAEDIKSPSPETIHSSEVKSAIYIIITKI